MEASETSADCWVRNAVGEFPDVQKASRVEMDGVIVSSDFVVSEAFSEPWGPRTDLA